MEVLAGERGDGWWRERGFETRREAVRLCAQNDWLFFLSLDFALYLSFFCILDSFVAANNRIEAEKKDDGVICFFNCQRYLQ